NNSETMINWLKVLPQTEPPSLNWLKSIPFFGTDLFDAWHNFISNSNGIDYVQKAQPHVGKVVSWLIAQISGIGHLIIHLLLMIVFCAVFYQKGEMIAHWTIKFARRIGDQKGVNSVALAVQAIRAVALGLVLTALIQTLIGGITLYFVQMPYFAILTFVLFLCCVAQIGPLFVLI